MSSSLGQQTVQAFMEGAQALGDNIIAALDGFLSKAPGKFAEAANTCLDKAAGACAMVKDSAVSLISSSGPSEVPVVEKSPVIALERAPEPVGPCHVSMHELGGFPPPTFSSSAMGVSGHCR